jgi:cytochrome c556
MRKLMLTFGLAMAGLLALPVQAQNFSKPEDAIRYRQSAYVLMGNHMGRIFGQLKADKPDLAAIQRSAGIIDFASQLPGEGYVPGSDKGGLVPTRAKPEVFTDPEGARDRQEDARRSDQAERSGQGRRHRRHSRPVSGDRQVLHSCHDNYRNK